MIQIKIYLVPYVKRKLQQKSRIENEQTNVLLDYLSSCGWISKFLECPKFDLSI
jgi:hypothetical protein